jgi:hypothetical protein
MKMFGFDDGTGRRWINLDHAVMVNYVRDQKRAEVFLTFSNESQSSMRVELQGEQADSLCHAMGLLEITGSHVKK